MSWAQKQHPVETLVEWVAPLPLGLSAGWAGSALGLSLVEAAALGIAFLTAGFAAMRMASRRVQPYSFEPVPVYADELLLEAEDELLELTDPLVDVTPDSRVVRLFARQEPTPGELVERITDFLGDGERPSQIVSADAPPPVDASAALHAALANIRASLR